MGMRQEIIQGTDGYYGTGSCLIARDYSSGCRNRYTVYYIPSAPSARVKIIGRELPLGYSKKFAKDYLEKLKLKCSKRLKQAIANDKKFKESQ